MIYLLRLSACLFVLLSFNVFAVDTDGDGFSDADEATLGTDPNDPTSPPENKLTASDGSAGDAFGISVSIDGDTAVIGAQFDSSNDYPTGSAYVFVRSNGVWSEQQKLIANDAMDLSLLITDNYNLDTSTITMDLFAKADLCILQHKFKEAEQFYDSINSYTKLPCRLTHFTRVFFDEFQQGIPFLKKIESY